MVMLTMHVKLVYVMMDIGVCQLPVYGNEMGLIIIVVSWQMLECT
jgi:hypothetical protein